MLRIKELQEQRNKLITDATAIIQAPNVTTEQRAQFDKMMEDSDVLNGDIERLKSVEAFQAERRSSVPRGKPGVSLDNAENAELEKRALREFMVSGKMPETRDLGVGPVAGSITGGAALVAPAFYPILTQAQKSYGGIVNIVNQRTTDTGASMSIASVNDTTNGLLTWAEDTAAVEVDPATASATSTTQKYHTGAILVTLEEIQDSAWDLDAFISDVLGQRLYRGLAKYISQGSSDGAFVSYLAGAVSGATSSVGTSIGYNDLVQLWGSVDPAYADQDAAWVMNAGTRAKLMSVVDTTGRPLFVPAPVSDGAFGTLLGYKVVLDPYAADIALGSKSLAFGSFKAGYTLRNVGQFEIARDPYTYLFSKGAIGFIGWGRGGSFATNAGTNPIKYLTQKAS